MAIAICAASVVMVRWCSSVKNPRARVLQIQHANDFVLVDKRHGEFGTRLRIGLDVARIFRDVGYQHRLLALRRVADQAAAQRDLMLEMNVLLEAQRESVLQFLARRIEQKDAEHLVIDQAAQQFGDSSSNSSRFRIEVSSRAISFSSSRIRACFVVRV